MVALMVVLTAGVGLGVGLGTASVGMKAALLLVHHFSHKQTSEEVSLS